MTFSIVARCPRSGQLGVAVSTAVPAVGAMCPFVQTGAGAVSTQSWVNPYLALEALDAMAQGMPAPDSLHAALARDDARDYRQIGLVDAEGRAAAWSGPACTGWFGQVLGHGFAVQGNMLVSEATVSAMTQAFVASADQPLAERLLRALEAGQAAGGDKRGRQSASLRVHDRETYPLVDLRVDEHAQPVAELRRVFGIASLQLFPFVAGMPRKGAPATPAPQTVVDMLALSPPDRPGGGGSRL